MRLSQLFVLSLSGISLGLVLSQDDNGAVQRSEPLTVSRQADEGDNVARSTTEDGAHMLQARGAISGYFRLEQSQTMHTNDGDDLVIDSISFSATTPVAAWDYSIDTRLNVLGRDLSNLWPTSAYSLQSSGRPHFIVKYSVQSDPFPKLTGTEWYTLLAATYRAMIDMRQGYAVVKISSGHGAYFTVNFSSS
ncbi:hypothetical protein F4778DRAFT_792436 [Xylariomycetidae sp. FL2044]|nr:hypothetical protein F4778DRAFT_792436 [Xylariomycetidae sp. FL2044]